MGKKHNEVHPALKHGAYSGTTLLPGEDRKAFEKLHADLIAEFNPVGSMEEDIVTTMAHLVWRKQNLSTYRRAEWAKNRHSAISAKYAPSYDFEVPSFVDDVRSPDQIRADMKAKEGEIRNELGDALVFIEMNEAVTIERLFEELTVFDRLDGMIDRCVKRLLMVRGVKSMSQTSAPSASRRQLTAA
jgi:hypothetical protein